VVNFLTLAVCAALVLYEASEAFRGFVQRVFLKAVDRG
jgi:hypothetical protein